MLRTHKTSPLSFPLLLFSHTLLVHRSIIVFSLLLPLILVANPTRVGWIPSQTPQLPQLLPVSNTLTLVSFDTSEAAIRAYNHSQLEGIFLTLAEARHLHIPSQPNFGLLNLHRNLSVIAPLNVAARSPVWLVGPKTGQGHLLHHALREHQWTLKGWAEREPLKVLPPSNRVRELVQQRAVFLLDDVILLDAFLQQGSYRLLHHGKDDPLSAHILLWAPQQTDPAHHTTLHKLKLNWAHTLQQWQNPSKRASLLSRVSQSSAFWKAAHLDSSPTGGLDFLESLQTHQYLQRTAGTSLFLRIPSHE